MRRPFHARVVDLRGGSIQHPIQSNPIVQPRAEPSRAVHSTYNNISSLTRDSTCQPRTQKRPCRLEHLVAGRVADRRALFRRGTVFCIVEHWQLSSPEGMDWTHHVVRGMARVHIQRIECSSLSCECSVLGSQAQRVMAQ